MAQRIDLFGPAVTQITPAESVIEEVGGRWSIAPKQE
jgi:hypothetical protein